MNYRHIYHAGNICDVVKHSVLALMIDYLKQKEAPLAVLDTHAGCGLYDLTDPNALKTGEAEDGIQKIWRAFRDQDTLPPTLAPYLDALRQLNDGEALRFYPGSPLMARGPKTA